MGIRSYILIVVFLLFFVGIASLFLFKEGETKLVRNVSMKIISPEWEIEYLNVDSKNNTVASFLFECANYYNFTIKKTYWEAYNSYLIEAINGIENGENNMYWQYYVNGEYATVGCSNYYLKNNDFIVWRFEPSKL